MSKYLYKFNWDCGRDGEIYGLFVATENEIKEIIGKRAYFGEVLGKHSEVCGTIEEGEIIRVDNGEIDPETIEFLCKFLGNTWCGYNPLHYVNRDDDEGDE